MNQFLLKLRQNLIDLFLLPFLRAVHVKDSLHSPYHSPVSNHSLVQTREHRSDVNHVLGTDLQHLFVERPWSTVEVGIYLVKQEHVQLIQHRVGVNPTVPHPPDNLRFRRHFRKFIYQFLCSHILYFRQSAATLTGRQGAGRRGVLRPGPKSGGGARALPSECAGKGFRLRLVGGPTRGLADGLTSCLAGGRPQSPKGHKGRTTPHTPTGTFMNTFFTGAGWAEAARQGSWASSGQTTRK